MRQAVAQEGLVRLHVWVKVRLLSGVLIHRSPSYKAFYRRGCDMPILYHVWPSTRRGRLRADHLIELAHLGLA